MSHDFFDGLAEDIVEDVRRSVFRQVATKADAVGMTDADRVSAAGNVLMEIGIAVMREGSAVHRVEHLFGGLKKVG